ncbi:tail fiber domain-containing protein [bacterium]|nr:tail fiber domain-containing protein [bacterium]
MAKVQLFDTSLYFSSSSTFTSANRNVSFTAAENECTLAGRDGADVNLKGVAAPVVSNDACNKEYADAVAQGLHLHRSCDYATGAALVSAAADITLALNAVPATMTTAAANFNATFNDSSNMSSSTLVPELGWRILVKDGSTSVNAFLNVGNKINGIWEVTAAASATSWTLTRADDMDRGGDVCPGGHVFVQEGEQADKGYVIAADFMRQANDGTNTLQCTGTAGSTTLTLTDGTSNYSLGASVATESIDYSTSDYANKDGSDRLYFRAGQGIKVGKYFYTITVNSVAAASTVTITPALRETVSHGSFFVGLNLQGTDADDRVVAANNAGNISDDATYYLSFTQFSRNQVLTGGTNITIDSGNAINLDATLNTITAVNGNGALSLGTTSDGALTLAPNGSGRIVCSSDVEMADSKSIVDDAGQELLKFSQTASAVNELTISNNAAGSDPIVTASGDDTDIGVTFVAKGEGKFTFGNGTSRATLRSNGDHDIYIETGNSTTGYIHIADGSNGNLRLMPNGTGDVVIGGNSPTIRSSGATDLTLKYGDLNYMTIGDGTLDVVLNGGSPVANFGSCTLQVGDLEVSSDARLKTNIQSIPKNVGRAIVAKLQPKTFTWKKSGGKGSGLIAQELEAVLPYLVTTSEHKRVKFNGLTGFMIAAVQDLQHRCERLEGEVVMLRQQLE